MQTLALAAVREAKLLEAPHRKTGNLGRTIHAGEITDSTARVKASANYTAYLEFGTKAHEITPNAKKALRWAASSGGRRLTGTPTRLRRLAALAAWCSPRKSIIPAPRHTRT